VAKVPVERLKPGMKVAKPVVNDNGMILFGAGTVLSDALIERLTTMGIAAIDIEGAAKKERPKKEMLAELDMRFSKTEKEPHMGMLKQLFKEYIERPEA
jgi:hypothetical protein